MRAGLSVADEEMAAMEYPTGVSKLVRLRRRGLHTRGLLLEETPRVVDEHTPLKRNFTGRVLLRCSTCYRHLKLSHIAEFRMLRKTHPGRSGARSVSVSNVIDRKTGGYARH